MSHSNNESKDRIDFIILRHSQNAQQLMMRRVEKIFARIACHHEARLVALKKCVRKRVLMKRLYHNFASLSGVTRVLGCDFFGRNLHVQRNARNTRHRHFGVIERVNGDRQCGGGFCELCCDLINTRTYIFYA